MCRDSVCTTSSFLSELNCLESNSKDTKRNTILTDLKILGILAPTKMLNIHILKYPHLRALYGVDIMLEKLPDDQVQVKILV